MISLQGKKSQIQLESCKNTTFHFFESLVSNFIIFKVQNFLLSSNFFFSILKLAWHSVVLFQYHGLQNLKNPLTKHHDQTMLLFLFVLFYCFSLSHFFAVFFGFKEIRRKNNKKRNKIAVLLGEWGSYHAPMQAYEYTRRVMSPHQCFHQQTFFQVSFLRIFSSPVTFAIPLVSACHVALGPVLLHAASVRYL